MALAGPVSHDREQGRKSKVEGTKLRERQREGGRKNTESERRAEEGKEEVKECSRGYRGLTI